jgi:2-keto-3-deoxy-L-rhamnonate aldolase RhmA
VNPFLDRLRGGELTKILCVRAARTGDIVRIARATGHHAVLIDLEHSAMSIDTAAQMSAVAGDLGLTALVRIPEREYGVAGRLLDGGAHGIIVPRVETADQARLIGEACRFPPAGHRSQLPSVPQLGMRPTPPRVLNPALDAATTVQVVIETPRGIANIDDIAAVDTVDMVALGTNDLTAELGIPGEYTHPEVRAAVAAVADACRRHDKLFMLAGIADLSIFGPLADLGACPLVLTGTDTDLLFAAARSRVASIDAWHSARAGTVTEGARP